MDTVRMIAHESRPCPKCHCRISKVDGCDQMWCVSCHATFSWSSGSVLQEKIHNPEYFRWMRERGLKIDNCDVYMGDLPAHLTFEPDLQRNLIDMNLNRIPHMRRLAGALADNFQLRVEYLQGRLTREQFEAALVRRERQIEKHRRVADVLDLVVHSASDLLVQCVRDASLTDEWAQSQFLELVHYANTCLKNISREMGLQTGHITQRGEWAFCPP